MGHLVKILKIGGSVITDKSASVGVIKKDNIETIAKELWENKEAITGKLILINGAGSFGHPLVKKYNITKTYTPLAAAKIHNSVKNLNNIFVSSLIAQGIPAVSVDPISSIVCNNGKIINMQINSITQMLNTKLVPVLYGDIVLDQEKTTHILSGDQIATYLAKKLKVSIIGAGSSEDGVYYKKNNNKIIKTINNKIFYKIKKDITGSAHTDVTGGMLGKVTRMLKLKKTTSYIFNATKTGNITAFLQNNWDNKLCTKITYF